MTFSYHFSAYIVYNVGLIFLISEYSDTFL